MTTARFAPTSSRPAAAALGLALLAAPLSPSAFAQPCHEAQLVTPGTVDARPGDQFGAVAVEGDTMVVGAYLDDNPESNRGSAYVFVRQGGAWVQGQKLSASDGAADDQFGVSVDISGNTIVVGSFLDDASGGDSGSAYVFVRSGTSWTQQQKIVPDDGENSDYFGEGVALDGNTALIGAHRDDDFGADSGSAYIYTRSGSAWTFQQKLTAMDGSAGDYFGFGVALDGDAALVGAHLDETPAGDSGAVYFFRRTGGAWTQEAKRAAPNGTTSDWFVYSVALEGDTAVVGAYLDDVPFRDQGSAYLYTRDAAGDWMLRSQFGASDTAQDDWLGVSVTLSGGTVGVGAPLNDAPSGDSGSVYSFTIADCLPAVCAADFDGNRVVNVQDFLSFLNAYDAGCP